MLSRSSLCLSLAITASLPASGSIEVGRTSKGLLYWHGHRVDPPYVASVGYRLDPDTVWTGVLINGFTLEPLRERRNGFSDAAEKADSAMSQAIHAAARRKGGYVRNLAEELRSHGEAVDSVVMTSDTQLVVYWRGVSRSMGLTVGDSSGLSASPPGTPRIRPSAESVLRALERDAVVLVSDGILYLPDRTGIDSLRAGQAPALRGISGTVLEELLHPEPLDSLRAQQRN